MDSTTSCVIDWSPLPRATHEDLFGRIRRSNLLQSLPYAMANRVLNQMGARHGIVRINGETAGLVQLSEVGLLGRAVHAVTLDRGPLWLQGYGEPAHIRAFFSSLAAEIPRRLGRKRRIIPESADTAELRATLEALGFRHHPDIGGYDTVWLDLTPDLDTLRRALDSKWRNQLSKAERQGLAIASDARLDRVGSFLAAYETDRTGRGYAGPTATMLATLIGYLEPGRDGLILEARQGDDVVAAVLFLRHGSSATYQAGWTTPAGRQGAAHNLLLWQGIVELKAAGVLDLDLGGINEGTAAGVRAFKMGLGGVVTRTVGFYS